MASTENRVYIGLHRDLFPGSSVQNRYPKLLSPLADIQYRSAIYFCREQHKAHNTYHGNNHSAPDQESLFVFFHRILLLIFRTICDLAFKFPFVKGFSNSRTPLASPMGEVPPNGAERAVGIPVLYQFRSRQGSNWLLL